MTHANVFCNKKRTEYEKRFQLTSNVRYKLIAQLHTRIGENCYSLVNVIDENRSVVIRNSLCNMKECEFIHGFVMHQMGAFYS